MHSNLQRSSKFLSGSDTNIKSKGSVGVDPSGQCEGMFQLGSEKMGNLGAKETVWCFLEREGLKRPEGMQRCQQRGKVPPKGGEYRRGQRPCKGNPQNRNIDVLGESLCWQWDVDQSGGEYSAEGQSMRLFPRNTGGGGGQKPSAGLRVEAAGSETVQNRNTLRSYS